MPVRRLTALLLLWATPLLASVSTDVDELLGAKDLRHATVGILVVDCSSGEVVYAHNPESRLMPASNMKVVTTAAAYELMGGEFRAPTRVLLAVKPDSDGCVKGPIYLRGGGDPALTHEEVAALAKEVARCGVRRVAGPVVADSTAFSDNGPGAGWPWDLLNDDYAAEPSALTVDSGLATVVVRGGSEAGARPVLSTEPYADFFSLSPAATTSSGSASPGLWREFGRNLISLAGPIGVGQRVTATVTVHQPALYCAELFRQALLAAGIKVDGEVVGGARPEGALELLKHQGPTLRTMLRHTNVESDNYYAEMILRDISMFRTGRGSARASVDTIEKWAEGFGADPSGLSQYDGSGLSRLNTVSARFLVQVLRHMQDRTEWVETLPQMGQDGTLAGRLKGTAAEGRVRAKTGYIRGVRGLSGYLRTQSGRRLAFSILVNQAESTAAGTQLQNAICLRLVAM
jgi:D-alanyl-D-alanine carboxypeptidase/D-alanyl-D-alanine-endopeptidase (penicillin-binding protein 4)